MSKYRVGLVQTTHEEATVYVEAGSAEEAEQLAIALANDGNVEWHFLESIDDTAAVSIDLIVAPGFI